MLLLRYSTRFYPFGRLERLSFIHFAHWSILDRIPANDPNGERLPHPYLLFQSNFNRGWREYVEAFCLVVTLGVRANWGGYGFPRPKPVGPFLEYVDKRFTPALHFYSAYPEASTRTVIKSIDTRRRFYEFAAENYEPPPRYRRKRAKAPRARALSHSFKTEPRDTVSAIAPIMPGREEALRSVLESLNNLPASPLENVTGTHMARWSIVAPLPYKGTDRTIDKTSYLLFTSWYEGTCPTTCAR